MTQLPPVALSVGADYDSVASRFRPIFERIATGVVERDQQRTLPYDQIAELKQAGFGALLVPVSHSGAGVSIKQLFRLLIELGAADSNLPQALRGHFAFVENIVNAPASAERDQWFARFVSGDLFGNAWTEVGDIALGSVITKVAKHGDRWILNGENYYSTGSIFADWIDVYAQRAEAGSDVIVALAAQQPGVTLSDDWDGFSRAPRASGTTVFKDAVVEPGISPTSRSALNIRPRSINYSIWRRWSASPGRLGSTRQPKCVHASASIATAMRRMSARTFRFSKWSARLRLGRLTPRKPSRCAQRNLRNGRMKRILPMISRLK